MAQKKRARIVVVADSMQESYRYVCTEPMGKHFREDFTPDLTPKQMLKLGVFGGKYLSDCQYEFPANWFDGVRFSDQHDASLNYFKVNASQSLSVWQKKGWIYKHDPRGWFQWYCRYYMGRRVSNEDDRQIKRWKMMRRHMTQVKMHCQRLDMTCRRRQRQALLHWAYDSRKF